MIRTKHEACCLTLATASASSAARARASAASARASALARALASDSWAARPSALNASAARSASALAAASSRLASATSFAAVSARAVAWRYHGFRAKPGVLTETSDLLDRSCMRGLLGSARLGLGHPRVCGRGLVPFSLGQLGGRSFRRSLRRRL